MSLQCTGKGAHTYPINCQHMLGKEKFLKSLLMVHVPNQPGLIHWCVNVYL